MKNPYTNKTFSYANNVSIYEQLHQYGVRIPVIMQLYRISNFSIRKLLCNFSATMHQSACLENIKEMENNTFKRECISTLEDLHYKPCVICFNETGHSITEIFHKTVYYYHLCTFSKYILETDGNKKKILKKECSEINEIKLKYPEFFLDTHPKKHRKIVHVKKKNIDSTHITGFNFSLLPNDTVINLNCNNSSTEMFVFNS